MMELTNIITGGIIIIINLIPLIMRKPEYLRVTITLSLLIGAIKVLFF